MNILYITKLSGNMWAGPNNSVPAQISAQAKFDNVFWYNLNHVTKEEWQKLTYYHNLNDFPKKSIKVLPTPFDNPDLVIFEGVYEFPLCNLVYECWNRDIPYIIVPRSSLTKKAQAQKPLKKKLGNLIFFKKFINRAIAIHYLTDTELRDSGYDWNDNHIIIPNGIDSKEKIKKNNNQKQLKGIYIGRIDIYQKGLDMLIKACVGLQKKLRKENCTINIYGPDRNNSKVRLNKLIEENGINDLIFINDAVFGEEKEKIQMEADFFVMTSRFEGHPMGLIEALSYGLPCIVTVETNMGKEIKNYSAGWIAKSNVDSIISAFNSLFLDKKQLRLKGNNAFELSKHYNWDRIAEHSHKEYENLIKGRMTR